MSVRLGAGVHGFRWTTRAPISPLSLVTFNDLDLPGKPERVAERSCLPSPYTGIVGRTAVHVLKTQRATGGDPKSKRVSEFRSCVKVKVAVLGFRS